MGGPSAHGQHNKKHKTGKHESKGSRHKHKQQKEGRDILGVKARTSAAAPGKMARAQKSKAARDAKRAELIEQKRTADSAAPLVVAVLPLSASADARPLFGLVLDAAAAAGARIEPPLPAGGGVDAPMAPVSIACTKPRVRLTLLPPPKPREDPMAIVEVAKVADVVVFALSGEEGEELDEQGEMALDVLRAIGLPSVVGAVVAAWGGDDDDAGSDGMADDGTRRPKAPVPAPKSRKAARMANNVAGQMKLRAAAKKRASAVLSAALAGDHKVLSVGSEDDAVQLMRHLGSLRGANPPAWRRDRATVMVQRVDVLPDGSPDAPGASVAVEGYVRGPALDANMPLHISGVGDFSIARIESVPDPLRPPHQQRAGDADMEGAVVATPTEARESTARENVPDPEGMDTEQTWPTEEELRDAEIERALRGSKKASGPKKLVPRGTSDYQAAWILDAGEEGEDGGEGGVGGGSDGMAMDGEDEAWMEEDEGAEEEDDLVEAGRAGDDDEAGPRGVDEVRRAIEEHRAARRDAEADDAEWPDYVEAPLDVPARARFAKYRGLKSFRTSPWDPKEGLPPDYHRIFAFDNFTRTKRWAIATAHAPLEAEEAARRMPPGTYVRVLVEGVPAEGAAWLASRAGAVAAGEAPPVACFGLLPNECKLSVVHFAVHKHPRYTETVANKEELLLVTGVRAWKARPVLSTDTTGCDKHKMERFLHTGAHSVASVYAPIMYPPLPLLGFKLPAGGAGVPKLAVVGAVKSCDPDRVVLKKAVLTGYPVRVHKKRATVRFMFHNPEDVRWFTPVELWTRHGRRGRIKEPVGTHGTMKCLFDGPVLQRDSVCCSLYKRAFPKWPEDMTFP
ncbi:unnamed protein product [Pedinophyceae sp. YPF-701]|nr:unnamed protein product [Pedinophyceae sp. YPF-701]